MKLCDQLQTMAIAYQEICQGEDPWIALGNFMDAWFGHAKDRREDLVADPIFLEDAASVDICRWAAFCAASAEWLSQRYGVDCPEWVHDPRYYLSDSWFYYPQEKVREWLMQQTPEPFTRRNIYCGDRMFENKYELAERFRKWAR